MSAVPADEAPGAAPAPDDALDVLAFGEALIDFFPERPGAALGDVDVFHRHLGGAPSNVALGLARQGARAGLMTLVGDDDFGRYVRARLAAEGVDVAAVGTHPGARTGITFVSVGAAGERSFLFFRHPSADQGITPADVAAGRAHIRRARVFHLGSSTLSVEPARAATLFALDEARAAGCIVSSDPNLRLHRWHDVAEARVHVRRLLAACDVVKLSDDELLPLVDTSDPREGARRLRALGATLALVTLGPHGCLYDGPAGHGIVPGEVVEVVDTTGAGDAFMAGVLATLAAPFAAGVRIGDLDDATVRAACVHGNHLGALAVTKMGATAGVPRREAE